MPQQSVISSSAVFALTVFVLDDFIQKKLSTLTPNYRISQADVQELDLALKDALVLFDKKTDPLAELINVDEINQLFDGNISLSKLQRKLKNHNEYKRIIPLKELLTQALIYLCAKSRLIDIDFSAINRPKADMVTMQPTPEHWHELHDYYYDAHTNWVVPTYKSKTTDTLCIILTNGGLWPLELVKEMPLNKVQITVIDIQEYLPFVAHLKNTTTKFTSNDGNHLTYGAKCSKTEVGVYRLWVDRLTGLTISHDTVQGQLDDFLMLFESFKSSVPEINKIGNEADLIYLPEYTNQFLDFVGSKSQLLKRSELVDIIEHIQAVVPIIKAYMREKFTELEPVDNPYYFITMGGSGSGKNMLIRRAQSMVDGNVVIASLDRARGFLGSYFGGVGGGLDYPQLDLAARIMRKYIMHHAKKHSYNIIRDCSGVPVEREKAFINDIKAKREATTTVLLATTCSINQALLRSFDRYKQTKRWVQPSILIEKHIQVSRQFYQMLLCHKLDEAQLYDNSASKGDEELVLTKEKQTIHVHNNKKLSSFFFKGLLNPYATSPERLIGNSFRFINYKQFDSVRSLFTKDILT